MDSLFHEPAEPTADRGIDQSQPLAARMRPRTLDEVAGQRHILAEGKLLRRAIEADRFTSLIFYGPPGTGKTTLAAVIANTTGSRFESLNGVESNVAEIRTKIEAARTYTKLRDQSTVLFIDEIHRFNKAQQDVLLPHIERGTVRFIGATTHNPYFYVNSPLVSRSQVFQLEPLETDDILILLHRALGDSERGFGALTTEVEPDALRHLADKADGDARKAITALELAIVTTPPDEAGTVHLTLAVAEESIQHKAVLYDSDGDQHYDTISAFIKSIRGSDPDAALYWLAKMLQAGEDPRFIARRLVISASEDIGLADSNALRIALSAQQAFDFIGMPEGRIPLAHATVLPSNRAEIEQRLCRTGSSDGGCAVKPHPRCSGSPPDQIPQETCRRVRCRCRSHAVSLLARLRRQLHPASLPAGRTHLLHADRKRSRETHQRATRSLAAPAGVER